MIMQEYIRKVSPSKFNKSTNALHCMSNSFEQIMIEQPKTKPQKPFPYLKRKSIRVDLVLKEKVKKLQRNQKKSCTEKIRIEIKNIKDENLLLQGKLEQMELLFISMMNFQQKIDVPVRNQACQTNCTSKKRKSELVQCSKCQMCLQSKYLSHHTRICGNTKIERILSRIDLRRLETIRKNKQSTLSIKPKNNWRQTRKEFLALVKHAKKNGSSVIFLRK